MKQESTTTFQPLPFRVRIGVTGHRQLADADALAGKVRTILNETIPGMLGDAARALLDSSASTQLAYTVVTPLAEGADRLVAREVLKRPNADIEVVLPFQRDQYRADFADDESRAEFDQLFAKARRPIVITTQEPREKANEDDRRTHRRQAYQQTGQYVVDHCDVLIALWDGQPSRGEGGTADIRKYARHRETPVIEVSTFKPFDISVEEGHVGINTGAVSKIQAFNETKIAAKAQSEFIARQFRRIFAPPAGDEIPDENQKLVRQVILPPYLRASTIAKRNQRLYRGAGLAVYVLSACALAAAAAGTMMFPRWVSLAFFVELLCLLAIVLVVLIATRRQAHTNWIEARFLAERLRAGAFLAACGAEVSPTYVPSHMRAAHRPDDWMVRAFHEIWNQRPPLEPCFGTVCHRWAEFVRRHWIEDQISFHEKRSQQFARRSRRLEWAGETIFVIALVTAALHLVLFDPVTLVHSDLLERTITFLAIALPAAGAAIGGIRTHREYSRLEKRSRNMVIVLKDLNRRFAFVESPAELEGLLRETEVAMLRENQDWLMLMRFVELKPAA